MAESTKFPTRPTYSAVRTVFYFCFTIRVFVLARFTEIVRQQITEQRCWFCGAPVADGRENHSFVFGGLDRKTLLCARFPLPLFFVMGTKKFQEIPVIRTRHQWNEIFQSDFKKNSSRASGIRGKRYSVVNSVIKKKKKNVPSSDRNAEIFSHGCRIYRLFDTAENVRGDLYASRTQTTRENNLPV